MHGHTGKVVDVAVQRFKCEACERGYRYPDSLRQHVSVEHGKDFLFPCDRPGCARGVVQSWQLKRHCWTHDASHDGFGRCKRLRA